MHFIKDTLKKYAEDKTLRLHMPGHKGTINSLDNTEIPQTDDFNNAQGAYASAQYYLSKAYSSYDSFFITTGTTTAIKVMVLYAKVTGRRVVAMRTSHISLINACCLYGVNVTIVEPSFCFDTQTYKSSAKDIIEAIDTIDEKSIIIATSPDYFGRCIDIKAIKKAIGRKDMLLFCDEAHGAHFSFSDKLPESAGKYADMWAHGAHKTLGALTQGAFLHCAKTIDIKKILYLWKTMKN